MKTLQFIARGDVNHTEMQDHKVAQKYVTQLLAEKLALFGFETLSQSGDHIAVSVAQYELPLAVTCQNHEQTGHWICEISSYPAEEQDWLDRIAEQSLLNQLAHAVESSLKADSEFSGFKWT